MACEKWMLRLAAGAAVAAAPMVGHTAEFDWRAHEGETIRFLANNHPWANAVENYESEFEQKTGIELKIDKYQEQQMRQRLVTVMNARSDEIDVFMTLPSREGPQFAASGWYADLYPMIEGETAPSYDFGDFSEALVEAATFDGALSSIPLNIEGPVVYYRTDVFDECGVSYPDRLTGLKDVAAGIAECDTEITPFVSRGLKPALPYTFSVFAHNMGGEYMQNGKSNLSSEANRKAIDLYANLLSEFGPRGVINYTFYQITSLYRSGKAAISFGSSNEFAKVMEGGDRLDDTAIELLPPGPGGSHPTVIGWGVSISKYSENKDAAWYFLQWATSKKMQERLALDGLAPPRASVADSGKFKKWIDEEPVRRMWIDAINEAAATGTSQIGYPIIANAQSREYMGQAVASVLLGEKSVEQAAKDADERLNRLIRRSQR